MADVTGQSNLVFDDGICSRFAVYSVKDVDAADTIDVAAQFRVVKRAGLMSDTGTTIAAISTITGTVLTIPAGPLADGVWLFVIGVSV